MCGISPNSLYAKHPESKSEDKLRLKKLNIVATYVTSRLRQLNQSSAQSDNRLDFLVLNHEQVAVEKAALHIGKN